MKLKLFSLFHFQNLYLAIICITFVAFLPTIALTQAPGYITAEKINGVSFYGPERPVLQIEMIESVKESNAYWIAFVPVATIDRRDLQLRPDLQNHWWAHTIPGTAKSIELANQAGLKVMLKPHMEISEPILVEQKKGYFNFLLFGSNKPTYSPDDKTQGATWRGDFEAHSSFDWAIWERSYETYILQLAHLADSLDVALFCIGTELRQSATKRPQFWRQLIKKVRAIYAGPLTYSANWDEYDQIPFWGNLDYIGIDAYFPVSESSTPDVNETVVNWQPILRKLKQISDKFQRKILITEFGYRNVPKAGLEPWIHDNGNSLVNNQAQVNLYEAFFRAFQQESFVAGSFLWQWVYQEKGPRNTDFSPQGKPGLEVVRRWYGSGE